MNDIAKRITTCIVAIQIRMGIKEVQTVLIEFPDFSSAVWC